MASRLESQLVEVSIDSPPDTMREQPRASSKIKNIFLRIVSSPLMHVTAIVLTSYIVALVAPMPALIVAGIGLLVFGGYAIYNHKKVKYEITLINSLVKNSILESWSWMSNINNYLFLGAIPLRNKDHLQKLLVEYKITAVLSVVEPFEWETRCLFSDPVTPEEWKKNNIAHMHLNAVDFDAVHFEPEQIHQGVEFIEQQRQAGKIVYVHCKAGRGRSAAVVICHLLRYGGAPNINAAISSVKARRPQMHLGVGQRESVQHYFERYCGME